MKTCAVLLICLAAAIATPVEVQLDDAEQYKNLLIQRATCGVGLNSITSSAETAFVTAHNQMRASENAGLGNLVWDAGLAGRAQELADKCVFKHDLLTNCDGLSIGQNLYAGTSQSAVTASAAVTSWFKEKSDYSYSTNTCASGKMCGHYTQVAWKNTQKVGCAIANCGDKIFGPGYPTNWMVVCDYYPPGNYNGQKPY